MEITNKEISEIIAVTKMLDELGIKAKDISIREFNYCDIRETNPNHVGRCKNICITPTQSNIISQVKLMIYY